MCSLNWRLLLNAVHSKHWKYCSKSPKGIFLYMECSVIYWCFLIALPHISYYITRSPAEIVLPAATYLANLCQKMLKCCLFSDELNSRGSEQLPWQQRPGKVKRDWQIPLEGWEGWISQQRWTDKVPKAKYFSLLVLNPQGLCNQKTILTLPQKMRPTLSSSWLNLCWLNVWHMWLLPRLPPLLQKMRY